jgi:site-specific DNA recombinase
VALPRPVDELRLRRFVTLGSATALARELQEKNVRNRYGQLVDKGVLYKLLNNRTYIGDAVHKDVAYPGEHQAIIERKLWDQVHAILKESPRKRAAQTRAQTPALLKGLIFDAAGIAMSPTHTRRKGRQYRYYISQSVLKTGSPTNAATRVPAGEIEDIVIGQLRQMIGSPEIIVATWTQMRATSLRLTESEVREALVNFDEVWAELFQAEQSRIARLLIDKVVVSVTGVEVHLLVEGFSSLVGEMRTSPLAAEAA